MQPNGSASDRHRAAPDYTREETYRATRAPVELATTLIPDAYRTREYYDVEQERVFSRGWLAR